MRAELLINVEIFLYVIMFVCFLLKVIQRAFRRSNCSRNQVTCSSHAQWTIAWSSGSSIKAVAASERTPVTCKAFVTCRSTEPAASSSRPRMIAWSSCGILRPVRWRRNSPTKRFPIASCSTRRRIRRTCSWLEPPTRRSSASIRDRVRSLKSTIGIWERSTRSLLSTIISVSSLLLTTRVFEFGNGELDDESFNSSTFLGFLFAHTNPSIMKFFQRFYK